MIDLTADDLAIVRSILREIVPGCFVLVFGSRVNGTAQRFSDIDIAVKAAAPVPYSVLSELREAFSTSDLPMHVDIVDYSVVSPAFRAIIDSGCEVLQV